MESIILRLEAADKSGIIDFAALRLDGSMKETAVFQTLVNPGEEAIESIPEKALETAGFTKDDLRSAPTSEDAANSLQAFLKANGSTTMHAFNVKRTRKLLEKNPWKVQGSWGASIRDLFMEVLEEDELKIGNLTLYDAARFFRIPIPMKRRALLDARIVGEILGKVMKKGMMSDIDFLQEAKYLIEDGF